MKKLFAIVTAVIATAFVLAPAPAEAGSSYKSKRIGACSHCGKSVYAYYRPVSYRNGCAVYSWVPSYHNTCRAKSYQSSRSYRPTYRSYRSYESYRPTYRSYGYSSRSSRGTCR